MTYKMLDISYMITDYYNRHCSIQNVEVFINGIYEIHDHYIQWDKEPRAVKISCYCKPPLSRVGKPSFIFDIDIFIYCIYIYICFIQKTIE